MIICITGATGFIGKKLVDTLILKKHRIKILSRNPQLNFKHEMIEHHKGDLCDPNCDLDLFLTNCDVLIHCAGELNKEELMYDLHVNGTKNILSTAKKVYSKTKKKIYWVQLSSCGAYGPPKNIIKDRFIDEKSKTSPKIIYEITKTISDDLIIKASEAGFISFSILRPSNVIGPGIVNPALSKIIYLLKKKYFIYIGKKGSIATFVHVDDVVKSLVELVSNPKAKGEIFNLSSDCKFEDLINSICNHINVKKPSVRVPVFLIKYPLSIISFFLGFFIHFPNLNIFLNRTRYPSLKIKTKLDFKFDKPLPFSIKDII
jgi:nucleoside-diphosphate-sugar epimerase